ncbi:MAG: hypothetical protein J7513_01650 [Solirubrobacteraceae bacterium]|nr:hypothetical protein [Solirubrobacteraceae bacterium]
MAVRMEQSLSEFEQAFADQIKAERQAAVRVHHKVAHRSKQRELDEINRRGTVRFIGLVTMLILTAVIVTMVMFKALYLILGG